MEDQNPKDQTETEKQVEFGLTKELMHLLEEVASEGGIDQFEPTSEWFFSDFVNLEIDDKGAVELNISLNAHFSNLEEFYSSFENKRTSGEIICQKSEGSTKPSIRELIERIRVLQSKNCLDGNTKIYFGKVISDEVSTLLENIELGNEFG